MCANAGICPTKDETLCSSFIDALDVDLLGVQNTVAVTLPHLENGASVIVTGSTAGMIKGTTDATALRVVSARPGRTPSWPSQ